VGEGANAEVVALSDRIARMRERAVADQESDMPILPPLLLLVLVLEGLLRRRVDCDSRTEILNWFEFEI
jgi:hypothetical protein